ncbi:integrator complex subunit 12-like [Harpegnathos saltator]|uniref:integrator complex subunit 12-like n=1 Tax=Harpegnathos saltator TaxID=610380 RepID=UPI00058EB54E|nr:integrator complex subunit 12-like [Harpegnathos saltator]
MSDIDKDFFNALALLHSTAENSTEELRRMLDACIERKHGRGKTLAARMPKRFLHNIELHDDATSATRTTMRREVAEGSGTASPFAVDLTENIASGGTCRAVDAKAFEVAYEECCNDEDVPRISIPDEGLSVDGAVCKICNGAKLGALILLECQECQEAYHPLCHQPPIVDVDVYDPRFVWRCRRCVDTSSSSVTPSKIKVMGKGYVDKVRQINVVEEKKNVSGSKTLGKRCGVSLGKYGTHRNNTNNTQQYE